MWRSTCCLFVLTCAAVADTRESRVVNIAQGPVRGYKDPDSSVYFFQSIPYATAPTGPNKFKAALPPPIWKEPREAVSSGIVCPQATISYPEAPVPEQQEDCLIASVYVPDTEDINLPVVVYVHGGGFQMGSGDMILPTKLVADENIIAVTFNYRLGVHGFLCLGTEDIPGNAGMKDQVTALRWVNKNIAGFGGNPDDVTLAGYSAGSAAVDLLMLSKSVEGLFNKVIPESGANVANWAIQSDPLANAIWFASQLNFTDVDDIDALEHFYKTISIDLLSSDPFLDRTDSTSIFSPCLERKENGEVILDTSPIDILKSGNYRKVPLLYGFANMEGSLRIPVFDLWKDKMNKNFADFLPNDLKFYTPEQKAVVGKNIKHFYFGDKSVAEDNILRYVDFCSDVMFTYSILRAVKLHVEAGHNQIYLYEYSFVDDNALPIPHTDVKGAAHCAQTDAVIGGSASSAQKTNFTTAFYKMSSLMRKIWGSFIKTGYPVPPGTVVPSWPPVGRNWAPHMSLGNTITLRGPLLERRTRFWDDIYSKHYRNPTPPSESNFSCLEPPLVV